MKDDRIAECQFRLTGEQRERIRRHINNANEVFNKPWFLMFASSIPYFVAKKNSVVSHEGRGGVRW